MAAEILVLPDAEAACIDELRVRLDANPDLTGIAAATRIPKPRPNEFYRITRVGGVRRDIVNDLHTLLVEGWALTETRAAHLCSMGVAYLEAAGRDGMVGDVVCSGRFDIFALPANLPDPSVPDRYRYTATISVTLRRVAV